MAIQNLAWGLGQPFFGAWPTSSAPGACCAWRRSLCVGLFLMAIRTIRRSMLHIGGGVLVGLGVAAGSFRHRAIGLRPQRHAENSAPWPSASARRRVRPACSSSRRWPGADQRLWLVGRAGLSWRSMMLIIPLLAIPLRGNARRSGGRQAEYEQTVGEALREALGHRSYLLLSPASSSAASRSPSSPRISRPTSATSASMPLCGDRAGADRLLQHHRLARRRLHRPALFEALFPGLDLSRPLDRSSPPSCCCRRRRPPSSSSRSSWACCGSRPCRRPTALVAIMFGTRHLGLLGGIVFLSHQIGSFLGVWLGGYLYDRFGTYDPVWWLGVALGSSRPSCTGRSRKRRW
jgi:hypothetical protein